MELRDDVVGCRFEVKVRRRRKKSGRLISGRAPALYRVNTATLATRQRRTSLVTRVRSHIQCQTAHSHSHRAQPANELHARPHPPRHYPNLRSSEAAHGCSCSSPGQSKNTSLCVIRRGSLIVIRKHYNSLGEIAAQPVSRPNMNCRVDGREGEALFSAGGGSNRPVAVPILGAGEGPLFCQFISLDVREEENPYIGESHWR